MLVKLNVQYLIFPHADGMPFSLVTNEFCICCGPIGLGRSIWYPPRCPPVRVHSASSRQGMPRAVVYQPAGTVPTRFQPVFWLRAIVGLSIPERLKQNAILIYES